VYSIGSAALAGHSALLVDKGLVLEVVAEVLELVAELA
jgi:hypothetical protein